MTLKQNLRKKQYSTWDLQGSMLRKRFLGLLMSSAATRAGCWADCCRTSSYSSSRCLCVSSSSPYRYRKARNSKQLPGLNDNIEHLFKRWVPKNHAWIWGWRAQGAPSPSNCSQLDLLCKLTLSPSSKQNKSPFQGRIFIMIILNL